MDKETHAVFNGIDGTTGNYLLLPTKIEELGGIARSEFKTRSPKEISLLGRLWRKFTEKTFALPWDVNPLNVSQAGWGIVFHHNESEEVKMALRPLMEHRRLQIGGDGSRFKILEYRDGESRAQWLARHQVVAGTVIPENVPLYLLLIGSPDRIPFDFGQQLDVEYAIGRIDFDTPDDYRSYAESVARYEKDAGLSRKKEVVFYGPRHDFDRATQMSADELVAPLVAKKFVEKHGYQSRGFIGEEARREVLESVLGNGGAPALLFSASHGMGFPKGHQDQRKYQGAILCQDWPALGSIERNHYFAAEDVPDDAHLHGMVVFQFACYGGGTPQRDRFVHRHNQAPPELSDAPFFSALPKRLLAHPNGGALAVIAHVDRAWGYSIATPGAGTQLAPFVNVLERILVGQPVGMATEDFNQKYAALSTTLASKLEQIQFGGTVPDMDLASDWIERNDAEGYIIFGDPAVRIHKVPQV